MSKSENELKNYLEDTLESTEAIAEKVVDELSNAIVEIGQAAKESSKSITADAIAAEAFYEKETDRIQNAKKKSSARYLASLKENIEKIKELRDEELKCLELSYELGIIDTESYFSKLQEFRDRYFEQGSVKWLEFTAKVLKHNKELTEAQEKALLDAAQTTAENIKAQFSELEKEQQKLEEKLSSGKISKRYTFEADSGDMSFFTLADIGAQNKQLERYLSLMSEAQSRINSFWTVDNEDSALNEKNIELRNSYFSQLRDMSIADAADFAQYINNVSTEKLTEHLGEYERRRELADTISKTLFASEVTDTAIVAGKNLGSDFTDALYEELDGLSDKFFSSGESACQSFGEGFMANLSAVLGELSHQINIESASLSGLGGDTTNNTSYNIYGSLDAAETIRLLREKEEMQSMLFD